MRRYIDSDIYDVLNRGNTLQTKMTGAIRTLGNDGIVVNSLIKSTLDGIKRTYKESMAMKVIDAINEGKLLLANFNPDTTFPEFIPFVKIKHDGAESMIIDVSRYTTITSDPNGELPDEYQVNVPKLYCAGIAAYLTLHLFKPTTILPADSYKYLTGMWTTMVTKVLLNTRVLSGNNERTVAFRHIIATFFLKYYMEAPAPIVESVATAVAGPRNALVDHIIEEIDRRELTPFASFDSLCELLFNAEITNLKGGSDANPINHSMYMQKFIGMYSKNAVMSLCAPEYLMFTLLSAYRKTYYVFDRAFDDIATPREMPRLLESLYKEL